MEQEEKKEGAPERPIEMPRCVRVKRAFDDAAFALIEAVGEDVEALEKLAAEKREQGAKADVASCPKAVWALRVEDGEDGVLAIKDTLVEGGTLEEAQTAADGEGVVLAERIPWVRRNAVAVAVAGAVVAVALVAGIAVAMQPEPAPEPAPNPMPVVKEESAEKAYAADAAAYLTAEGWTEEGSCAELKVSVDASKADEEVLKAFEAAGFEADADSEGAMSKLVEDVACNAGAELGKLPEGVYEVFVKVAPVAADGSVYKAPEEPAELNVKEGFEASVEIALERTAFEDLSADDRAAAIDALEVAGKSEAAEALGEKAAELDGKDTSSSEVGEKSDSYSDSGKSEASSGSGGSSSSPSGGSSASGGLVPSAPSYSGGSSASGGSSSSPSGGSSASGGLVPSAPSYSGGSSASGGSSSDGGSTPPALEQPAPHVHTWVTVVDSPAWTENVQTGSVIYCACGASFGSDAEAAQHKANAPWDEPHNTWVEPVYGTVEHPAVTHQECSGCGTRG